MQMLVACYTPPGEKCRVLGADKNARQPNRRDEMLCAQIQCVWDENFQVYGVRKDWWQLRREGFQVARCAVERRMHRRRRKLMLWTEARALSMEWTSGNSMDDGAVERAMSPPSGSGGGVSGSALSSQDGLHIPRMVVETRCYTGLHADRANNTAFSRAPAGSSKRHEPSCRVPASSAHSIS